MSSSTNPRSDCDDSQHKRQRVTEAFGIDDTYGSAVAPNSFNNNELPTHLYECSICMCPISYAHTLTCGDTFCYKCISDWSKSKEKCPLCMSKFTLKSAVCNRTIEGIVSEILRNKPDELLEWEAKCKAAIDTKKGIASQKTPSGTSATKTAVTMNHRHRVSPHSYPPTQYPPHHRFGVSPGATLASTPTAAGITPTPVRIIPVYPRIHVPIPAPVTAAVSVTAAVRSAPVLLDLTSSSYGVKVSVVYATKANKTCIHCNSKILANQPKVILERATVDGCILYHLACLEHASRDIINSNYISLDLVVGYNTLTAMDRAALSRAILIINSR